MERYEMGSREIEGYESPEIVSTKGNLLTESNKILYNTFINIIICLC